MDKTKKTIGDLGEGLASAYLKAHGHKILKKNFRSRFGEIDIISTTGRYLCFVEVKTRGPRRIADGREFVTMAKQKKIVKTAEYYIICNQMHVSHLQPRFDIIEIALDSKRAYDSVLEKALGTENSKFSFNEIPERDFQLTYIENAF